ncbi:putative nucleoside phosphorylase domain-containing protein [Septoria linicola]|nr:putative nucleoside phosphorylase domain-containing protein [Septoria linicola]
MVGIGGGVPSKSNDIRLGDVVVSQPCNGQGGVTQWDFGKVESKGFRATGHLDKPPRALLDALTSVKTRHERPKRNFVKSHLSRIITDMDDESWEYQGQEHDILFDANYDHVAGTDNACDDEQASVQCDLLRAVQRKPRRVPEKPIIHYGTIASGDAVMKNGHERDRIGKAFGALCFEMEAAGLEDNFPCIVIRGIRDHSDSHKRKNWQRYSAASAAAFARELLENITPQNLEVAEAYSREPRNCT